MLRSIEDIISLSQKKLDDSSFYKNFSSLYGGCSKTELASYDRLYNLCNKFETTFSKNNAAIFSASGRTELSGNHTDHNNGYVLAGSINLDKLTLASPRDDNKIIIYTDGIESHDEIDITNTNIIENEKGSSKALIRGIANKFKESGYRLGGFEAYIDSLVLFGSGLSSSASFEVLVGMIFNVFYNDSKIKPLELAMIGQYAENIYFDKPCGLMDQIACAVGGIVSIDFEDNKNPKIEKVEYDFTSNGYTLIIVDTKGDHSNLTDEYSAIRKEMNSVAKYFNKDVCRSINEDDIFNSMSALRNAVGDRAILRAMHFFADNKRVLKQINALKNNDIKEYIKLTNESGLSSYMFLQNVYSVTNVKSMSVGLAYMLSQTFLKNDGAIRVHGGGFAGTVEAIIPNDRVNEYISYMDNVFGEGSSVILSIRQVPVCCI